MKKQNINDKIDKIIWYVFFCLLCLFSITFLSALISFFALVLGLMVGYFGAAIFCLKKQENKKCTPQQ